MSHGYAAFAKEDREDAKRRMPARTLEAWAAGHGLEQHGRVQLAGFRPALPEHLEYTHGLVRGALPGGRFGAVWHELVQTHFPGDTCMPGRYYATFVNSPGGIKRALRPDRTWIPIIGSWLTPPDMDGTRPFGETGAWAPATTCAIPVPVTVGRLPRLLGRVRPRAHGFKGQDDFDAGAFRFEIRGRTTAAVAAALKTALAPVTERFRLPFADLQLDEGVLRMRRNGYAEGAELDTFCAAVAAVARVLEQVAGTPSPADFAEPLPPCPWRDADEDTACREPGLAGAWTADLRGYAGTYGLTLEDARAWHERFGTLWAPGHAVAVMAGTLPDGRAGRVLFTTDAPIPELRALRGAIAFATPGRADTPDGGVRVEGATVQVRDGVTYVFAHRTFGYTSEAAGMPAALLAAAERV